MHFRKFDLALKCEKKQISIFFSHLIRAAKAQTRLCIGINSTEPSLLEDAISTK